MQSNDLNFFQVVGVAVFLATAARAGRQTIGRDATVVVTGAQGWRAAAELVQLPPGVDGGGPAAGRTQLQRTRRDRQHCRFPVPFDGDRLGICGSRRRSAWVAAMWRPRWPGCGRNTRRSPSLSLFQDPLVVDKQAQEVMIHVGQLADSELTAVRLADNQRILCAAPAYVPRHSEPKLPNELRQYACAVIREDQDDATSWTFSAPGQPSASVHVTPAMSSNDGAVIKH